MGMTVKRNVWTTADAVGSTFFPVDFVQFFRKRQIVLHADQDLPIVVLVVNMYMSTSTYQDINLYVIALVMMKDMLLTREMILSMIAGYQISDMIYPVVKHNAINNWKQYTTEP